MNITKIIIILILFSKISYSQIIFNNPNHNEFPESRNHTCKLGDFGKVETYLEDNIQILKKEDLDDEIVIYYRHTDSNILKVDSIIGVNSTKAKEAVLKTFYSISELWSRSLRNDTFLTFYGQLQLNSSAILNNSSIDKMYNIKQKAIHDLTILCPNLKLKDDFEVPYQPYKEDFLYHYSKDNAMFKKGDFLYYITQELKKVKVEKQKQEIFIQFIVTDKGLISGITIKPLINSKLENEIIKIVKKTSGQWYPALIENQPVTIKYILPLLI